MRTTRVMIVALLATAGCARAQTQTTPAPRPRAEALREIERERADARREREDVRREVVVRQRELSAAARERAEQQRELTRVHRDSMRARADSAARNRATLGLTLGNTGSKRDTIGIFVNAVVDGGPAERAGIVEGDRIVSINGIDLRTSASDAGDAYLANVARHRLQRELRRLAPGQVVNIRMWSGGRYRDVQVTAGRYSDVYRNRRISMEMWPGGFHFEWPEFPEFAEFPALLEFPEFDHLMPAPGAQLMPAPAPGMRIQVAPRIEIRRGPSEPADDILGGMAEALTPMAAAMDDGEAASIAATATRAAAATLRTIATPAAPTILEMTS